MPIRASPKLDAKKVDHPLKDRIPPTLVEAFKAESFENSSPNRFDTVEQSIKLDSRILQQYQKKQHIVK
jgi:hypothetical protein